MTAVPTSELWRAVASVPDPEIPDLTIEELAILCGIRMEDGRPHITLRPTHLGCPAFDWIKAEVRDRAVAAGWDDAVVEVRLTPPWSTDDISIGAREKLKAHGIACAAPSQLGGQQPALQPVRLEVSGARCPRCHSHDTQTLSTFGASACKSLMRCNACKEPFDLLRRASR